MDPAESQLLDGYQDVVLEDGLVLSVTPSGASYAAKPEKPEPIVVDLAGKYLCPCVSCAYIDFCGTALIWHESRQWTY